jgi:hypothetical protein
MVLCCALTASSLISLRQNVIHKMGKRSTIEHKRFSRVEKERNRRRFGKEMVEDEGDIEYQGPFN